MLALVKVPWAGDNKKCVKSITLHSSYLGSTAEYCVLVPSGPWNRSLDCSKSTGSRWSLFIHFLFGFSVIAFPSPIWICPGLFLAPYPVVVSQLLLGELLGGRCATLNPRTESRRQTPSNLETSSANHTFSNPLWSFFPGVGLQEI